MKPPPVIGRQPGPHAAWNAVWAATVPSLARRSSFRTSFSRVVEKSGSGCESAMLSAVLAKRGLRPRRKLRTSSESEMTRPTSRSESAVAFIRWA
jgi:hypothetical protein